MGSRPMLDMKILREQPEVIRANLEKRGDTARIPVLENAMRWDRDWREGQRELDHLRHQRNVVTGEIRELKAAGRGAGAQSPEAAEPPERITSPDARVGRIQRNLPGPHIRLTD